MDDLKFGKRNKRGDWAPAAKIETAPIFRVPFKLGTFLKWVPHYFLPWNLLFALSAVLYWRLIVPDVETMKTLSWAWPLRLFGVNCLAIFLFFGAFELRLYILRSQENRFKYNG